MTIVATTEPRRTKVLTVQRGRLTSADGRRSLLIGAGTYTIGRSQSCDFVLDDPSVSSLHAEIQATPVAVRLIDQGSRNGTFSAGNIRLLTIDLVGPCDLRFGDTWAHFEPVDVQRVPVGDATRFGPLVGATTEMRLLFDNARRFAEQDGFVLITGETGTGKDVLARAIHGASGRRAKDFIPVNCARLSNDALSVSELFGHERGSFTGADRAHPGLLVMADGGTFFFNEVAELTMEMQAKLLDVFDSGSVLALGAKKARHVNVRAIFATNVDLKKLIDKGRFREDLYFRIARFPLKVPALRERAEDIPLLVRHFLQELGRPDIEVDSATMGTLMSMQWRGNVRQLRNFLEYALVGSPERILLISEALTTFPEEEARPPSATETLEDAKRRYFTTLFRACNGNVTHVAIRADIGRSAARENLRKYGLLAKADDNDDDGT